MTASLINFHLLEKNASFVKEYVSNVIGQGLVDSWDILLFGRHGNVYRIAFDDGSTFVFREEHVIEWRIAAKMEQADSASPDLQFRAFGVFEPGNVYCYWYSYDCDCVDQLRPQTSTLSERKVIDITVTNDTNGEFVVHPASGGETDIYALQKERYDAIANLKESLHRAALDGSTCDESADEYGDLDCSVRN